MISGISIGIDLVSVSRVERILERDRSKKRGNFVKVITEGVKGLGEDYSPKNLAEIWAIKEALIKAWPYPFEGWRDVKLYFEPFRAPVMILGPGFQKRIPGVTAQVSISYENDMVVAVVLLYCKEEGKKVESRRETLSVVGGRVALTERPVPNTIKITAPGLPKGTYLWMDDGEGNLYGLFELKEVVNYTTGLITLEPNPAGIRFDKMIVEYKPVGGSYG